MNQLGVKYCISKKAFILCFLCFYVFIINANAQKKGKIEEITPCVEVEDEKALKLYYQALDKKKYKKPERMKFLKAAIELEPNFVEANCLYARELVKTIKYQGGQFTPVIPYFQVVLDNCPDYHSDAYYYVAKAKLAKEEYEEAMKLYKNFIKFNSENEDAYNKHYDEMVEDAKLDYEYAKFYFEVYLNPVPFNPKVVKDVSTKDDEYLPLITPDNEKILFTRRFEDFQYTSTGVKIQQSAFESDKKKYAERFSYCMNLGNGKFDKGHEFEKPFNQDRKSNYGGATISIDNKRLIFTVCKPIMNGQVNCDLYESKYVYGFNRETGKDDWHWTEPVNLGDSVNTRDGWEAQPSLSADGKTLYFASFREGSRGMDIYYSKLQANGKWGPALNLGEPINTEYHDKSPFIHSDSHTLYYSSQGHMGFGGFDVFYAKATEDGATWNQPKNIGTPINSEEDEVGFIVSTDGRKVYYSSDKMKDIGEGGYDIFSFELYKEARPERVVFLKGSLHDEDRKPIKDAVIEVKNPKTDEKHEFKVDTVDGSFAAVVTLKDNEDMIVNVKSESKEIFETHLFMDEDTMHTATFEEIDITAKEIKVGETFKINDIHYNTNSAEIQEASKLVLDELVSYLKEHPSMKIAIHGHTDNRGDAEANMALSTDRAYSVEAYLQEKGIEKGRLSFKGFGETKPIASNDTPEGREKNRRTEFLVVSK